ncbi:DUF4229 domain-containing protein [Microbacterium sp. NPDC028030]|uniref:DUF4229 domain-containing protein n=1 Tax=Microbacterium sp. NPDC028030 TaxID=3155124 RepID=UPI0033FA7AAA
MKKPAPILVYTVLRLLAFLVPLAILWVFFPIFREFWWLAAIFAALIGMSISMLFLRTPLTDASARLQERRESRTSGGQADADAEDQAIDDTSTSVDGDPRP